MPESAIPEEKLAILSRMGAALLMIQSVESALRMTTTFIIQREGGLTLEKLEAQERHERDKTIGYFLSQLRHRVDVDPEIDSKLRRFLDLRNALVHDVSRVPNWGTDTPQERQAAHAFLAELLTLAHFLLMFFSGLMKSWMDQNDFVIPVGDDELQRLLNEEFVPIAEGAFYEKGTLPS